MLSVKIELLEALAASLETLLPGSGNKAVFESPKVAAHGDLATTVAMQLAKPLKMNPRQLAENLKAALLAAPAVARWVESIDIAGPGFINIKLKAAAKHEAHQEKKEDRKEKLKPSVLEELHKDDHQPSVDGKGPKAGEGSLRAKWTPATKPPPTSRGSHTAAVTNL